MAKPEIEKRAPMPYKIKILADGPYQVEGGLPVAKVDIVPDAEGASLSWKAGEAYPAKESYILCRCGRTGNPPYCDGSHVDVGFDGTETSGNAPFAERAETTDGPVLVLKDVVPLCSVARFCLRAGEVWTLTEKSDDPEARKTAVQEACDCPSGRLVAIDKATGAPIEPPFEPSIGVTEEPHRKLSGPLWVRGGVPIESASGTVYEIRNRVTLCRCGASENKPFCDGTHVDIKFNDGDKSVE